MDADVEALLAEVERLRARERVRELEDAIRRHRAAISQPQATPEDKALWAHVDGEAR